MSQSYLFPVSPWDFPGFGLPVDHQEVHRLATRQNDRIDAKRIANYAVLHYRKLELYKLPDKDLVRLQGMDYYT